MVNIYDYRMGYGKYSKKYRKTDTKNVSKAVKHYVSKQIAKNIENKMIVWDTSGEFNSISNVWTELNVSDIDQGTSVIQRVGRQVRLKSLEINMTVQAGDESNIMRLVVGLFSGSPATPLASTPAGLSTAILRNTVDGMLKKYLDKFIVCDGVSRNIAVVKYYKKFKGGLPITWSADAGSQDRKLYVSMLSDSTAVTHPSSFCGRIILRFEDA